jgi:hypothetical protein
VKAPPRASEYKTNEEYEKAHDEFYKNKRLQQNAVQPQSQSSSIKMKTGVGEIISQPIEREPAAAVVGHYGGSRKRRHIHKLSRRIERTLRRVQNKYGLKDKADFLRRTLRARKMK